MKRLVIVVFVVVAAALAFVFFTNDSEKKSDNTIARAKTVVPVSTTEQHESVAETATYTEEVSLISLIPLRSDETVLNTIGIDFDNDGYDDQINAIKRSGSPYIVLLVGLYNPFRGQYDRTTEIVTEIMQTQTFSFMCMDITGDHKNSLIYSGFTEDGNSIMRIFLAQKSGNEFNLINIGDFRSDGTIFIQQLDRYDSYEARLEAGVSFPVWVYSSDSSRGGNTLDQLQTMYTWNPQQQYYIKSSETRVKETKVASKELSRIQDGTVETFANHLDGLWYKTSTSASNLQYIFFNPSEEEIIFQTDDSQEVYTWVSSTLRRNGIYISAVNSSVNNLTRRIDISLTGTDEIKIRNQDDVRMTIKESNLWDGQYKKQTSRNAFQRKETQDTPIITVLENHGQWLADGITLVEFADGTYTLGSNQTGRTATRVQDSDTVLQLRGTTDAPFYNHETYIATVKKDKTDGTTTVELIPVTTTPLTVERTGSTPIRLVAVAKES